MVYFLLGACLIIALNDTPPDSVLIFMQGCGALIFAQQAIDNGKAAQASYDQNYADNGFDTHASTHLNITTIFQRLLMREPFIPTILSCFRFVFIPHLLA